MRILVVRRDNIGDLVVTTPVFTALRRRFPGARIEALVNSYNAAVLDGHPDVDVVHVYRKSKHSESRREALADWAERLAQWSRLRRSRFDAVILVSPGYHPRQIRQARAILPREIVAFCPPGVVPAGVTRAVPWEERPTLHHLRDTFNILSALGIEGDIPRPSIVASPVPRPPGDAPRIGIHVSARRPLNRWPEARFAALLEALQSRGRYDLRLYWAPGAEDDPRHPGDDEKAARLMAATRGRPVAAVRTTTLRALIDELAACDLVVCSDGGAMHIAAALGKPIVCFFGESEAAKWHPWEARHRLLQPASRDAADITVAEALAAFDSLAAEAGL